MTRQGALEAPSPFVVGWSTGVAARLGTRRRALDVAIGRGRHVQPLQAVGFTVFGVDVRLDAIQDANRTAGGTVLGWCADLTEYPLPADRFELVLVTRYLQRDLFPGVRGAVTRGGFVAYETFTEAQRALGRGPTSPDHLLKPGELPTYFEGWEILFYEETAQRDAVARLVGRKPVARARTPDRAWQ